MKRLFSLGLLLAASGIGTLLQADTFTWQPTPANLADLDHYMAITWRISGFNVPTGHTITGAQLKITNIYNWSGGTSADRLFVNLLNTSNVITGAGSGLNTTSVAGPYGTTSYVTFAGDSFPTISDFFDSGNSLASSSASNKLTLEDAIIPKDAAGGPVGITYTHNFSAASLTALASYISSTSAKDFAFGFDPDCHYFNSGVSFTLTTTPAAVPEPGSIFLLGTMAAAVAHKLRKRSVA